MTQGINGASLPPPDSYHNTTCSILPGTSLFCCNNCAFYPNHCHRLSRTCIINSTLLPTELIVRQLCWDQNSTTQPTIYLLISAGKLFHNRKKQAAKKYIRKISIICQHTHAIIYCNNISNNNNNTPVQCSIEQEQQHIPQSSIKCMHGAATVLHKTSEIWEKKTSALHNKMNHD